MSLSAPKLNDMSRVLCSHRWNGLEEWVSSIDELADLSDDEIIEIERMGRERSDHETW